MRLQNSQANCGPASLSNALAAVGIERSQDECERLCKTTGTMGTSPKNLVNAARAAGRAPLVINERRGEVAALFLDTWLRLGRSAIICVDSGEHWIAVIGVLGERVVLCDPADSDLVFTVTRGDLVKRWTDNGRFYGVVV